mgnify:CR=1 FL=1
MDNAFGDHEQFASLDGAGQLSFNIHFYLTLEDIEEIIGRVMLMESLFADIIQQAPDHLADSISRV